jgi:diguanylate cyclase (GGDEF)-like protein
MGGDEFAAILPQMENEKDISKVAKLIIKKLATPFDLNGKIVSISASIGIAIYPKDAILAKELLQYSDKAMYDAKKSGRGKISYHF